MSNNPFKKTMVYFGLANEHLEDDAPATPVSPKERGHAANAQAEVAQRGPITPLRRVTPARQAEAQSMNEIFTVHPIAYSDAQKIAESFRSGVPVIMNLSRMVEDEAKRLIDFASGLTLGLNGRIERVTSKVFLLSPAHILASSDADVAPADDSFFVSSSV